MSLNSPEVKLSGVGPARRRRARSSPSPTARLTQCRVIDGSRGSDVMAFLTRLESRVFSKECPLSNNNMVSSDGAAARIPAVADCCNGHIQEALDFGAAQPFFGGALLRSPFRFLSSQFCLLKKRVNHSPALAVSSSSMSPRRS